MLRVIVGVGGYDLISMLMGVRFERAKDIEEERILQIRSDHAQRAAGAFGERTRVQVGVIVKLRNRPHHPQAGGIPDYVGLVQDTRYGRGGNSRALRDFVEVHLACRIAIPLIRTAHRKGLGLLPEMHYFNPSSFAPGGRGSASTACTTSAEPLAPVGGD